LLERGEGLTVKDRQVILPSEPKETENMILKRKFRKSGFHEDNFRQITDQTLSSLLKVTLLCDEIEITLFHPMFTGFTRTHV
jgi:hypothetical protein